MRKEALHGVLMQWIESEITVAGHVEKDQVSIDMTA